MTSASQTLSCPVFVYRQGCEAQSNQNSCDKLSLATHADTKARIWPTGLHFQTCVLKCHKIVAHIQMSSGSQQYRNISSLLYPTRIRTETNKERFEIFHKFATWIILWLDSFSPLTNHDGICLECYRDPLRRLQLI